MKTYIHFYNYKSISISYELYSFRMNLELLYTDQQEGVYY